MQAIETAIRQFLRAVGRTSAADLHHKQLSAAAASSPSFERLLKASARACAPPSDLQQATERLHRLITPLDSSAKQRTAVVLAELDIPAWRSTGAHTLPMLLVWQPPVHTAGTAEAAAVVSALMFPAWHYLLVCTDWWRVLTRAGLMQESSFCGRSSLRQDLRQHTLPPGCTAYGASHRAASR